MVLFKQRSLSEFVLARLGFSRRDIGSDCYFVMDVRDFHRTASCNSVSVFMFPAAIVDFSLFVVQATKEGTLLCRLGLCFSLRFFLLKAFDILIKYFWSIEPCLYTKEHV